MVPFEQMLFRIPQRGSGREISISLSGRVSRTRTATLLSVGRRPLCAVNASMT